MKVILTGGAGFIGSCFLKTLNDMGVTNVIVVDNINSEDKTQNLKNKKYLAYYDKTEFLSKLNEISGVTHIVHLGACSSTTETNVEYLYKNNVEYGIGLYEYALKVGASFIYASSAATYGLGERGFSDKLLPEELTPLNPYGVSKNLFDKFIYSKTTKPKQVVGLKFFNVYGPNENHKKGMYSMVFQGFNQVVSSGKIRLFKSNSEGVSNGEQKRDFIYVKDVCKVLWWCARNENVNGIFNVGTGKAKSFNDLANAVFKALNIDSNIEYFDMPSALKNQYQNYTVADMSSLNSAGYKDAFYSLEEGVFDYITNYLAPNKRY